MGSESTNSAAVGVDRGRYEKEWAAYEARQRLGQEDKALWNTARYTVRPNVYFNKILIAWTFSKGAPLIKEIFSVIDIDVSFQDGIWLRLKAQIAGREVLINSTPRRLLPNLDVIGWVPFFNECRFASADWNDPSAPKNLRLAACFKMRDDLERLVEGQDYLTELHVFRSRWPLYKDTRF